MATKYMIMNRKNILKVMLLVGFGLFLYFYSLSNENQIKEQQEKENKDYPLIEKINKDYHGFILDYYRSEIFRGRVYNIELLNGERFAISGMHENPDYEKKSLYDNLSKGDSIFYNHKTFEFYIYKKDRKELYFKLFNNVSN